MNKIARENKSKSKREQEEKIERERQGFSLTVLRDWSAGIGNPRRWDVADVHLKAFVIFSSILYM